MTRSTYAPSVRELALPEGLTQLHDREMMTIAGGFALLGSAIGAGCLIAGAIGAVFVVGVAVGVGIYVATH